jgi:coenzyme F420-reducing hydrogenase delta subunit
MCQTPQRMRIVVLYCQHSVRSDAGNGIVTHEHDGVAVQTVMLPCSSKVQASELLSLLAAGVDGVEIVACQDRTCRFLVGSHLAGKRLQYARRLLNEAHVRGDRLGLCCASGLGADELQALGLARAAAVQASREGGIV